MATYLMDLDNECWTEVDVPFAPDNIGPMLQYVGNGQLTEGYFVASFVKGTVPLYPGTITGQIDIMMLQHKDLDSHIVCARDTLQ